MLISNPSSWIQLNNNNVQPCPGTYLYYKKSMLFPSFCGKCELVHQNIKSLNLFSSSRVASGDPRVVMRVVRRVVVASGNGSFFAVLFCFPKLKYCATFFLMCPIKLIN